MFNRVQARSYERLGQGAGILQWVPNGLRYPNIYVGVLVL